MSHADVHMFACATSHYNALFLLGRGMERKVLGDKIRQHLIFDVLSLALI
jgi:hypothetical protein